MQSDSCSINRLKMASKRVKTFLFQNAKKSRMKKSIFYWVSIKDILASRKARNFCKKGKIIFIKNSLRWAQSGFCSLNRLEVTSKTINLYPEWLVQQVCFRDVKLNHSEQNKKLSRVHELWKTWIICKVKTSYNDLSLSLKCFSQFLVN